MTTTVTTQQELDAAIERGDERIIIDSPRGVWLRVGGSSTVTARDSSTVEARGSSIVTARDSSIVTARESSTVTARESSTVEAWGSSTVEAWGSSTVEARGSSTVEARESSTVTARDSSTVTARDSSTVTAGKWTAVHLHSARATITGGVVIDVTNLDLTDPTTWCDYHGATTTDGKAIVYKAVSPELLAGQGHRPTEYPIGGTVTAPDWSSERACGRGLHFSPSPAQAAGYYQGYEPKNTLRYLACEVDVATLVPLEDKVKAPSCRVLHEVDRRGRKLTDGDPS